MKLVLKIFYFEGEEKWAKIRECREKLGNYRQKMRIETRGANEKREGLKENIKMGSFERNFFVVISNFKALLEHFYLKMARLWYCVLIKMVLFV